MDAKIKISDGFNKSFSLVNEALGTFLLIGVILFGIELVAVPFGFIPIFGALVAMCIGLLVMPALYCGVIDVVLQSIDKGKKVEAGDIFRGFDYIGGAVLITIVVGFFVVIAMLPGAIFIVPGILVIVNDDAVAMGVILIVLGSLIAAFCAIIVAAMYVFAYVALVDKKCSFWEAMEISRRLAQNKFWAALGIYLIMELMELIGAMFCGIGVIYTVPLSYCFLASVYRTAVPAAKPKKTVKRSTTKK